MTHLVTPSSQRAFDLKVDLFRSLILYAYFLRKCGDDSNNHPHRWCHLTTTGRRQSFLRNGLQMQDYLLVIRGSVGTATGIRVALIGPTGEVPGGVLVVVSAGPQGNERLVLDEDLLDILDSLLLRSGI